MADVQLKYGTYTHSIQEAGVVIEKEVIESDQGVAIGHLNRWNITGRLTADTQSELLTAIDSLETAYGKNGKNIVLQLEDGTVVQQIKNSQTVDGVRVKFLSFPVGTGAQLTTFRDYQITVTGEVSVGNTLALLQSSSQTISITGNGGVRRVVREMRNGPPVEQIVSINTPVQASQSGQSVGRYEYPAPANPLWPAYLVNTAHQVTRTTNSNPRQYITSWNYQFISPGPL